MKAKGHQQTCTGIKEECGSENDQARCAAHEAKNSSRHQIVGLGLRGIGADENATGLYGESDIGYV